MAATVLTIEAAEAANIPIIQDRRYEQAVFDHIMALRAGRRAGTACTKTRAEVSGSGAKPWRQKGTGRARAGSKRSPIWRGGGVVFGPRPRDYSVKVNRKVRRLALRKAFSERVRFGDVLIVDSFNVTERKTKQFIAMLSAITTEPKTLVLSPKFDEKTVHAARAAAPSRVMSAHIVTTEDLLNYRKIVITADSLPVLAQRMLLK
jgi:large subunit ribosomal protein L4